MFSRSMVDAVFGRNVSIFFEWRESSSLVLSFSDLLRGNDCVEMKTTFDDLEDDPVDKKSDKSRSLIDSDRDQMSHVFSDVEHIQS